MNSLDNRYNDYKGYILNVLRLMNSEKESIEDLITLHTPWSNKIEQIRNEYNVDRDLKFNFFTSISDIYYRENFHSDILKHIIDPSTAVIGNKLYIDIFIDVLNEKRENNKLNHFSDDVKVKREEGRIDILIEDEKQSIIIENKINYAVDQENQLARYVEYLERTGNNIAAIVYLTPIPGIKPDLNFSNKYAKYKKVIEEKIIYLPAIDGQGEIDLAHSYLARCISQTNNMTAKVYLEQYSQLLKHLGGKIMTKGPEKKILEDIYSSQEKINTIMEIVEIWNSKNKADLLTEIIQESIKKVDSAFQDWNEFGGTIYKEIDDDISTGFASTLAFGFVRSPRTKELEPQKKNNLKAILDNKYFDKFSDIVKSDDEWVYREIKIDDIDETKQTIKELTALISLRLKRLEELYLESQSK